VFWNPFVKQKKSTAVSDRRWYKNCSFSSSVRKKAYSLYRRLRRSALERTCFKCLERTFFSRASLIQARACPMSVLISVIFWTWLMSANTEAIVGCCWDTWMDCIIFAMSGDAQRLLSGLWLSPTVNTVLQLGTFLIYERKTEVNISHASTMVSPRFSN